MHVPSTFIWIKRFEVKMNTLNSNILLIILSKVKTQNPLDFKIFHMHGFKRFCHIHGFPIYATSYCKMHLSDWAKYT